MAVARLVVIQGPDKGEVFDVPLRGGGIGRDAGNTVRLSDPTVSRSHCSLQLRDGELVLVHKSGRHPTCVNGQPIDARHRLEAGDEIAIGATRMVYQPVERAIAMDQTGAASPTRLTMEVGSRELLGLSGRGLPPSGLSRAHKRFSAMARFSEFLLEADSGSTLCRAAAEQCMAAMSSDRAYVRLLEGRGQLAAKATVLSADVSPDSSALPLSNEHVDSVLRQGNLVCLTHADGPVLAVPLFGRDTSYRFGERPIGLLCVQNPTASRFVDEDIKFVSALANILSVALDLNGQRRAMKHEIRALSDQLGGREFVGRSDAALLVRAFVDKVGPSDATVLLTGESGSGKEMVARAVHQASRRRDAPFVAVNCAALTETLIESELFGHEKGAFTGATERKLGRFELADRGTLFLDEVGELPLSCQTKFLRVLEEQVFERVGGSRSIAVNTRVIAATNRDLMAMAQTGRFREDLYYRLSVIHAVVPPLRERSDDIALLSRHFLERLRHQVPRRIDGFADDALQALMRHSWPGNVRELKNAIERAIVLGDGPLIQARALPPDVLQPRPPAHVAPVSPPSSRHRMPTAPFASAPGYPPTIPTRTAGGPGSFDLGSPPHTGRITPTPAVEIPALQPPRPLRELEKQGIVAALRATGGNKAKAAQLLEIDRSTLYKKIKDYGIT